MEAKSGRDLRGIAVVLGLTVAVFVAGLQVARFMDRDEVLPASNPTELATSEEAQPTPEVPEVATTSRRSAPAARRSSSASPSGAVFVVGTSSGDNDDDGERRREDEEEPGDPGDGGDEPVNPQPPGDDDGGTAPCEGSQCFERSTPCEGECLRDYVRERDGNDGP